MKAQVIKKNIIINLELSQEELDWIMTGIGNCSHHKLMNTGMTGEQADALIAMWMVIDTQCGSEYSTK